MSISLVGSCVYLLVVVERGGTDPLIRSSHKNAAALRISRIMHVGDYLGLGEAQTGIIDVSEEVDNLTTKNVAFSTALIVFCVVHLDGP
jgi:hypothetical protein